MKEKLKNIEYVFHCGDEELVSCRGVHKVTIDDVLNIVFGRLIHFKEVKEEELTEEIIYEYYLKVKQYMDSLTDDMFSHWYSIQIDSEIAIGFMSIAFSSDQKNKLKI